MQITKSVAAVIKCRSYKNFFSQIKKSNCHAFNTAVLADETLKQNVVLLGHFAADLLKNDCYQAI